MDRAGFEMRRSARQKRVERKTNPGYHHGPALNTPKAINTLLLRRDFQKIIEIEGLRLVHQAADFYGPWPRHESARGRSHAALFRIELVKIIVVGDVFERCQRLVHLESVADCFI